MSFPRYLAYKDSGIAWLGQVPSHWVKRSLQDTSTSDRFAMVDGPFGSDLKSEEYVDEGVPLIQLNNIGVGVHTASNLKFITEDKAATLARHCAVPGDLVIAKMAEPVARAAVVSNDFPRYTIVADCIKLSVDATEWLPQFLNYWMNSAVVRSIAEVYSAGITRLRINLGAVKKLPVFELPLPEQNAIADFLDRETAKIDTLVAEQEQLITLLKEKRQAVISHAVTKGLDPSVPMKDSGVEWLGEVPAHWKVMPIRLAARLESGHTPSRSRPDWWLDCTVPWFSLADVWQIREAGRDVVYETKEMVSELGLANSSARLLPKGTVMLSRTASVGFAAIMGVDMATTQDFANWVCGQSLLPEFLLDTFKAMKPEFNRMMMGSTHNTIYMPDIQAFRFALPSMNEQAQIVAYVRDATAQSDELIAEAKAAVSLLKERRSALISAAVTGQIDVRGLAPAQEQAA